MEEKIQTLEDAISSIIRKDNGAAVTFNYDHKRSQLYYKVQAFTVNAVHKQRFLLKEGIGHSFEEALEQILHYVKKSEKKTESTWTVLWMKKGDSNTRISYFSAENIWEALRKFEEGNKKEEYFVYEAKISSVS